MEEVKKLREAGTKLAIAQETSTTISLANEAGADVAITERTGMLDKEDTKVFGEDEGWLIDSWYQPASQSPSPPELTLASEYRQLSDGTVMRLSAGGPEAAEKV